MSDDLVTRLRIGAPTIEKCYEAADRIEKLEKALKEIFENGKKTIVATWDSPPENRRQDTAHLWARLAICVDNAEEALGEKKDG
jgi:hypothetical protein